MGKHLLVSMAVPGGAGPRCRETPSANSPGDPGGAAGGPGITAQPQLRDTALPPGLALHGANQHSCVVLHPHCPLHPAHLHLVAYTSVLF